MSRPTISGVAPSTCISAVYAPRSLALMVLALGACGPRKAELAPATPSSRWSWTAEEVEAEMVSALERARADLRSPRLMATYYVRDEADGKALLDAARTLPRTDAALLAPGADSLVPIGITADVPEPASLWHVRLTSPFAPADQGEVRSWVRQLWTFAPDPPRTLGSFGVIDAAR